MIFLNLFTCTTEKEVVARWRVVIRPKMAQGQSYSYLNFLQIAKSDFFPRMVFCSIVLVYLQLILTIKKSIYYAYIVAYTVDKKLVHTYR